MTPSSEFSKFGGPQLLDSLASFSIVRIISAVLFDICYNDKGQEDHEGSMG